MNMMSVFAVMYQNVKIHLCIQCKFLKKLQSQLCVIDSEFAFQFRTCVFEIESAAQIDCHSSQNLIHCHCKVAVSADAFFVAQKSVDHIPHKYSRVFHTVMTVYFDVPSEPKIYVYIPMFGYMGEHMLEKRDLSIEFVNAFPIEIQIEFDIGFGCFPGFLHIFRIFTDCIMSND